MKKIMYIFILFLTFSASTYANDNYVNLKWEGKNIAFDVQPQIINDRTMLPMRALLETSGFSVSWDDTTKTAHCANSSNITYELRENSDVITCFNRATNKSENLIISTPIICKNGRLLFPVRALEQLLPNIETAWNDKTRTVTVKNKTTTPSNDGVAKNGIASYPYFQSEMSLPSNVLANLDSDYRDLPTNVVQDLINKKVKFILTNNGANYGTPHGGTKFYGPTRLVHGDNGPEYQVIFEKTTGCDIILTYEPYDNETYGGSCAGFTGYVRFCWMILYRLEPEQVDIVIWKNINTQID